MKKIINIFLLFQFSVFVSKAQYPYFSSLNQQLLSINPAFAGSNKGLRFQTNYAASNPNFTNNAMYYYFGADILVKKHHGFGISFFSNDYWKKTYTENQINLSYAYHFIVNNKIKIVPAFQVSGFSLKLDRTKIGLQDISSPYYINLQKPNLTDQDYGGNIASHYNMDFSAGLLVYGKNYYYGASVLSLTQPDEGLLGVYKRPLTQIYQGGYNIPVTPLLSCNMYGLLKFQTNVGFAQYGAYLGNAKFKLHLAHRINEGALKDVIIMGFNYTAKGFRAGYNVSVSNNVSGVYVASSELYLSMNFGPVKKEGDEKSDATIKLMD